MLSWRATLRYNINGIEIKKENTVISVLLFQSIYRSVSNLNMVAYLFVRSTDSCCQKMHDERGKVIIQSRVVTDLATNRMLRRGVEVKGQASQAADE